MCRLREPARIQGLSGATILGNGSFALIIDLPQLVDAAENGAKIIY